jgi:Flp pilus assembly protein TadG
MRPPTCSGVGNRRGSSLVYVSVALVTLTAFCSLGVDVARVQTVKTELRRAADAAARYAVTGLPDGINRTQAYAADAADDNTADGSPVELDVKDDVEFGHWDYETRTFTVLHGANRNDATAVRVTVRRTKNRGNAVPLLFAKIIGAATCDVQASATASLSPIKFGVVGLDYIKMGGNSTTAYWSASGSGAGNFGNIGSNGDITLTGSSQIAGNARPGSGRQVYGSGKVSGSTTPLSTTLSYPNGDMSPYLYGNNNNYLVPDTNRDDHYNFTVTHNRSLTLPAGVYLFNDVDISGTLSFTGPATIYCAGNLSLSGRALTSGSTPKNLTIIMAPNPFTGVAPGSLTVTSASSLYANIYAPQSPIFLSGNGDLYGSVVGKSIDMTGTSSIHYDLSLNSNGGAIALVQ